MENPEEQEQEKEKSVNNIQAKEENIKYMNTESQNQIEQEKEIFYLNDLNNKETLLKEQKDILTRI